MMLGVLAASLLGCPDNDDQPPTSSGTTTSGGGGTTPAPPPISAKATVKFKAHQRLLNDLSTALSLPVDQVCAELGQFACGDVHVIALGGVDPYGAGIYEPLKSSAVTTPIAVDRLVLAACQRRAHADFQDLSSAVIFKLQVNGGQLADANDASVDAVITDLFHRVHLREPKPSEVTHLRQLYVDIEARGGSEPAKDWATLSCYAVASMMESVFY